MPNIWPFLVQEMAWYQKGWQAITQTKDDNWHTLVSLVLKGVTHIHKGNGIVQGPDSI